MCVTTIECYFGIKHTYKNCIGHAYVPIYLALALEMLLVFSSLVRSPSFVHCQTSFGYSSTLCFHMHFRNGFCFVLFSAKN